MKPTSQTFVGNLFDADVLTGAPAGDTLRVHRYEP